MGAASAFADKVLIHTSVHDRVDNFERAKAVQVNLRTGESSSRTRKQGDSADSTTIGKTALERVSFHL